MRERRRTRDQKNVVPDRLDLATVVLPARPDGGLALLVDGLDSLGAPLGDVQGGRAEALGVVDDLERNGWSAQCSESSTTRLESRMKEKRRTMSEMVAYFFPCTPKFLSEIVPSPTSLRLKTPLTAPFLPRGTLASSSPDVRSSSGCLPAAVDSPTRREACGVSVRISSAGTADVRTDLINVRAGDDERGGGE